MIGLTPVDIGILVAYFAAVAAIGFLSARAIRDREDFLLGGRRFGKVLMVFFSFGAGTHADNAVGVAARSYQVGLAGIWYQWVMLFTLPVYWLLAPVFRRARVMTTADFFERRYGRAFSVLYAAFALFVSVSFTSVMLFGSARLVEALTGGAIDWRWAILLLAVLSFAYGIAGGLVAAVWNDFLQGILTVVMSVLILPFFWARIGGLEGLRAALPDHPAAFRLVLPHEMTLAWIGMMSVNSLVSMVAQPHIMASAGAARTEMDSRVGFVGGMILKRLVTVPWALTGVMAIALFGAGKIEPDHAFGAMARELLPSGFAGLMLACIMASVMDNCAVMMLAFAGLYTNNIHKKLSSGGSGGEARLVAIGRLAAAAFAVISIALAYAFRDVPAAMQFLWKTVPLMGIPFFLALWRRTTRAGAFASFAAALVAMLIAEYGLRWTGDAGLPKAIALFLGAGFLTGIVVSLTTRPEPARRLEAFMLLLRTPVGQEETLRRAGLVELPDTGTFELPDGETGPGREEAPSDDEKTRGMAALRRARREAIGGFATVTLVMLVMLGAVIGMAAWLGGP